MSFHKFKKQYLEEASVKDPPALLRVINTLQANIDDSLAPMVSKIQNDSLILSNVQLVAGQTNIISHRLGRQLLGWCVVRCRSQAQVWDSQDTNPSPTLTLQLLTSANVSVDLLVF
jgi:hypothetical protein